MKFNIMRIFAGTLLWATLHSACDAVLFTQRRVEPSVYPVSKVVDLLKSMKDQLEKEADADEEVYEKLACWCQTNDKAKTQAIADAETHLTNLEATIQKNTALSATLRVEIKGLEKEVARNVESLETATALRKKQKADFIAEEKEMVQSIQALGAAVTVLAKHHSGASLLSNSAVSTAMATVKAQLQRHGALLQGTISPRQRRTLAAFVQGNGAGKGYFDSTPTFKQNYEPQSGEIFGILRQMKATFENDLSQSQKDEVAAQEAYDGLKEAKEEEIRTGKAALQDKKEQVAKSDEALVQAKADREDTETTLAADKAFLGDLKIKCSLTDKEWEERQKLRKAELVAVAEAISILASDDARDLFSKTFNRNRAAFVQLGQVDRSQRRERAASLLAAAAARTSSPKLSVLAASVKLDTFVRVKKAIDDMVAQLLTEKSLEIEHRDSCIDELNTNEKSTAKELHTKNNLESKVATLKMKIEGLQSTIDTLNAEIKELKSEKEKASQNRKLEKKEFAAVLAEQKDSESLLQQALAVLKSQYEAKGVTFAQQVHQQGASPPGFQEYDTNGQSPGVLGLIEHIIQNCKQMQQETLAAENAAQDAYTVFVQETTKSVEAKDEAIINRTAEKSQADKDLLNAQSELTGTVDELGTLSKGASDLHSSCDFFIKNFDERQEARNQEVEALRQAKAYLSGME